MKDYWIRKSVVSNKDLETFQVFCIKNVASDSVFSMGIIAYAYEKKNDIVVISNHTIDGEFYGLLMNQEEFKSHFERM